MADHEEEPTGAAFSDARLQAELRFTEFRDAVAVYFDDLYRQAHPDVRWDSEQFAHHLTQYSFESVGVADQYSTHPGTAQLFDIYRRLVFAFTNPADLTDGVDESQIRNFIDPVHVTPSRDDKEVNMQLFINELEVKTTFVLSNVVELGQQGRLAGMTYAERFKHVTNT